MHKARTAVYPLPPAYCLLVTWSLLFPFFQLAAEGFGGNSKNPRCMRSVSVGALEDIEDVSLFDFFEGCGCPIGLRTRFRGRGRDRRGGYCKTKVGLLEDIPVNEQNGTFNSILKLPHVSRP